MSQPALLLLLPLVFAAVCLWQMLAGLAKMRRARGNPGDPAAPVYAKMGKLQAVLGGVFLAGNILLNLPALGALLGGAQ